MLFGMVFLSDPLHLDGLELDRDPISQNIYNMLCLLYCSGEVVDIYNMLCLLYCSGEVVARVVVIFIIGGVPLFKG
jgi:hypothetical protein